MTAAIARQKEVLIRLFTDTLTEMAPRGLRELLGME